MPFLGAVIGGVASLASGAMQGSAAGAAAGQQAGALNNATNAQLAMFAQSQAQLQPYMAGGTAAEGALLGYLGLGGIPGGQVDSSQGFNSPIWQSYVSGGGFTGAPGQTDTTSDQAARRNIYATESMGIDSNSPTYGSLLKPFTAQDLNANLAPNYAFQLGQGQTATTNSANLSGGALSGNALKALNDYTQNYAGNAYQQAYQNYNTNQNNIFTRLGGVAQSGQNAATNSGTNAITTGQGIAGSTAAAGAATAGGTIGAANAYGGAINNAGSMFTLGNMLNNNSLSAGNNYLSGYQNIIGGGISAGGGGIDPLSYGQNYG